MPSPDCFQAVNFCLLRATRLNADGSIDFGTDVVIASSQGITIGASPITSDAERYEQKNGCGVLCAVYDEDCDVNTGFELNLELCTYEFRLAEMMTGGTLETVDGTVVGFADRDPLASCPYGVVFEAYAIAWNGDERAIHPVTGDPAYLRFKYPRTKWRADDDDHEAGLASFKLTGKAIPNSAAALGPDCDWPAVINGPRAIDLVSALPTASCEYGDLVACS